MSPSTRISDKGLENKLSSLGGGCLKRGGFQFSSEADYFSVRPREAVGEHVCVFRPSR